MAATQPNQTYQTASPASASAFLSNNPFRRAASPAVQQQQPQLPPLQPPPQFPPQNKHHLQQYHSLPRLPSVRPTRSPFDESPPPRPISRNPFLDPALVQNSQRASQPLIDLSDYMSSSNTASKPLRAEDIFASLNINDGGPPTLQNPLDGPRTETSSRRGPPPPPGRENIPPGRRRPPPNPQAAQGHRPNRSQEDAMPARRPRPPPGSQAGPFDNVHGPQRRSERRPRRNSDTSILDIERNQSEEDRRREARRRERERERRYRENKDKKPVNRRMDVIDKLDATSIFGTGLFHHDGPFDAVNPHRNRPNNRRAPIQAFPKDSLNNVVGGSGPLNARPDHATFMGRGEEEAFMGYAGGPKGFKDHYSSDTKEMPVFDPTSRGAVLHGDETLGLGTSTFLEGTPAARTVIKRCEEERAADMKESGGERGSGLQRKLSIAQRFRGNPRTGGRDSSHAGRGGAADRPQRSPTEAGRPTSCSVQTPSPSERNPFFRDFENGGNPSGNKTEQSPTSPQRNQGLERCATTDATGALDEPAPKMGGTGLLARVKSLKGGRRPRPTPPTPTVPNSGIPSN